MNTSHETDDWIEDANGNRASIAFFGSKSHAETALATLKNCKQCTNCSNCSNCSGCSSCSNCSDCSECWGCSNCSGCLVCSKCSNCSNCLVCSKCSNCSNCLNCSECLSCSECSECTDCLNCSNCSECSECLNCSECSECTGCSGIKDSYPVDYSNSSVDLGPPIVPVIPNIDAVTYAAASQPEALSMTRWHCGTSHCRAGWVVELAGPEGKALEAFYNTELAALKIYKASDSPISPVRFYDTDVEALADMKSRADAAMGAIK